MTYELANELKDAGFPQEEKDGWMTNNKSFEDFALNPDGTHYDKTGIPFEEAYIPTLFELIEACGAWQEDPTFYEPLSSKVVNPCFFNLYAEMRNGTTVWIAGYKYRNEHYEWVCEGKTPEEAVAMLWLALNSQSRSE